MSRPPAVTETQRIMVSGLLPEEVLAFRRAATDDGRTLSNWMRRAAQEKLERQTGIQPGQPIPPAFLSER